jgi:hypothetical protein
MFAHSKSSYKVSSAPLASSSDSTSSKTYFELANNDFKNECNYIYALVREQRTKVIDTYSTEDDSKIDSVVTEARDSLFDIYTQEMPILGYTIMNVSDSNPYWSYHYYSERYVEAKRCMFNAIRYLDETKIEEFTWQMEGCFLALRVMGKMT